MNATLNETKVGRKLVLRIESDQDTESPCEFGGWKLVDFGNRQGNPENYIKRYDGREVVPANIGIRRKLAVGLAHFLSKYDHSGVSWSLMGEGTQCRWDTTRLTGVLVWDGKPSDIGAKTVEDRERDARQFLKTYNEWANGECYYYSLETQEENQQHEQGDSLGSCGGFIGQEHLESGLAEVLKAGDRVVVEGDCEWIAKYLKLPEGVEVSQRCGGVVQSMVLTDLV